MLDILLIVVIGGMGTIYGAVIGAALFVLAQNYLQDLMRRRRQGGVEPACRCCRRCCHPDRWLLWLGLLFVPASTSSRPASSAACAMPARDKSAGASH